MTNYVYRGFHEGDARVVTVDDCGLSNRPSVFLRGLPSNAAFLTALETDFQWGHVGCRAKALALAILTNECGPEEASRRYPQFCADVISKLPASSNWGLTSAAVQGWLLTDRELRPLK